MREVSCPSCGSPLAIDRRYALFVVCESCDVTVVVDEAAARIHGKMGALAPPEGVLYLGATGTVQSRRFRVVGRVRYGYSRGYWNEWLLALDQGGTCWISEDEDELELEELQDDATVGSDWSSAAPGDRVPLDGRRFHVDEKETATCEGGEGQLPFPIVQGERVPYLELSDGGEFVTVEFDQGGARVFRGRRLAPRELRIDVSREEAGIGADVVTQGGETERVVLGQGSSRTIHCDGCGAPLEVPAAGAATHACEYCGQELDLRVTRKTCASCSRTLPVKGGPATHAATCPHCQALLDVRSEKTELLMSLAGRSRPSVPLKVGMRGRLGELDLEIRGHMRLVERDSWGTYTSNEFSCRDHASGKDLWIVLEDGHYSLKRELHERPNIDPRGVEEEFIFSFDGRQWEVDDVSEGASETIDWVEGEFTWVPRAGDKSSYMEAESPPYTLIAEWSATEMEWYRARYLAPAEVVAAFGLAPGVMPRPSGAKAGAPPAVRYPPPRRQPWVLLALSVLCLLGSVAVQQLSTPILETAFEPHQLLPPEVATAARRQAAALDRGGEFGLAVEEARLQTRWAEQGAAEAAKRKAEMERAHATLEAARQAAGGTDTDPVVKAAAKALADQEKRAKEEIQSAEKAARTAQEARAKALERAVLQVEAGADAPATSSAPSAASTDTTAVLDYLQRRLDELRGGVPDPSLLPSIHRGVPTSWPAVEVPFEVPEAERGCRAEFWTRTEGSWVYLDVEVVTHPEGEVVHHFANTLLHSSWQGEARVEQTFVLPRGGSHALRIRGAPGLRGSNRVALPAGADSVRVELSRGLRTGRVLLGGAALFFLWMLVELFFRVLQLVAYSFRVAAHTISGVFS